MPYPNNYTKLNILILWGYIGIMENKMETTIIGLYRDYYIRVNKPHLGPLSKDSPHSIPFEAPCLFGENTKTGCSLS